MALAFGAAGELTWSSYEVTTGEVPFPSVADGLYLASYADPGGHRGRLRAHPGPQRSRS